MTGLAADPLYDRHGNQVAYHLDGGRRSSIRRANGQLFAVVIDDAVFARDGQHIGWLVLGKLYDHEGHLVLTNAVIPDPSASDEHSHQAPNPTLHKSTSERPKRNYDRAERSKRPTLTGLWSPLSGAAFFALEPAPPADAQRRKLRSVG